MERQPDYTIHKDHMHFGWNRSIPPAVTIAPGDRVEFETLEASGGQISTSSTVEDIASLDFSRVNPVCLIIALRVPLAISL